MAGVKKNAAGAQSAAQQAAAAGAGNDTAAKEKPVSGPQNAAQDGAAEYTKFVYIGPSLPRGIPFRRAEGLSAGKAADCPGSQAGRGQRKSANTRKHPA